MKLLHVINSLGTGGAEKLILETISLYNRERDISADLVVLKKGGFPFEKLIENKNINIKYLSGGSVYNPLNIIRLGKVMRKYNIVHVHLFPSQYWVVFAKIFSFSKVQLIFTEHSTSNRRISNIIFNLIDRFIYKFYSGIICITDGVKNVLSEKYKIPSHKLFVIHNGINVKEILEAKTLDRKTLNLATEDIILVMVAGFRMEKDHLTIINSMKDLDYKYKLLLVGEGKTKESYETYVKEQNLSSRVFFLGNRNDVPSILKMSNVAILSSHYEGFGLAAVESMVVSRPTIGSNVPGLSDVLSNGGIVFEKGNTKELVSKIIELEDLAFYNKIAEMGRKKAMQYDINFQINSTISVYKSTVK